MVAEGANPLPRNHWVATATACCRRGVGQHEPEYHTKQCFNSLRHMGTRANTDTYWMGTDRVYISTSASEALR
jgi:hypothetical protein